MGLSNMKVDGMFLDCRLEFSSFTYLLGSAIAHQLIWDAEVRNEFLQRLTGTALVLHQICSGKERLIGKDLCMLVAIQRLVATIHGVCVDCTTNVRSYNHPVCMISPRQWEYGGTNQPLCGDLEHLCHLTQSDVPPFAKIGRSDGQVPLL